MYLQTLKCLTTSSQEYRRRLQHNAKNYLFISDMLYRHGVDSILHRCLTNNVDEPMLNDFHGGACGGNLSRLATTQNILIVGYYWPSIFKDCINAVKRCHPF